MAGDLRGFATAAILTAALATTPASAEKHRDAEGLDRADRQQDLGGAAAVLKTAKLTACRRFGHGSMEGQCKPDLR